MIGNIFVVSLEERQDRRLSIKKQLDDLGWEFRFWNADKNDDGKLGLYYSMLRLLLYCQENVEGNVLILEDDALILPTIDKLENAISQLPESFDLCYLGANLCEIPKQLYSENLIKVKQAYATHAILYSPTGIEKVLKGIEGAIKQIFRQPIDVMIVTKIQKDGNCYCTFPLMCSQITGYSSIEKREVDYTMFIEKRFETQTKHLI